MFHLERFLRKTSVDVLAKDGVPHRLKTGSERDMVVISDLCLRTAVRKTGFTRLRQKQFLFFVSIRVQRSLTRCACMLLVTAVSDCLIR